MIRLVCIVLLLIHGDLHERISKLTTQIEEQPGNAALYLKRAELYFQHEDYELMKRDLCRARELSEEIPDWDLRMARALHALSEPDSALFYVTRYLNLNEPLYPVRAAELKAEILLETGAYLEAAQHFEWAVALSGTPSPGQFVQIADAHLLYDPVDRNAHAEQTLVLAQETLGHLYVFDERLLEIYHNQENYTSAIAVLSDLIDRSIRDERFYYQRAEVYIMAGDMVAASRDLDSAERAWAQLPRSIRNNAAMRRLKSDMTILKEQIR